MINFILPFIKSTFVFLLLSFSVSHYVQAYTQEEHPQIKQKIKSQDITQNTSKKLSAEEFMLRHQCTKHFDYDVYLAGAHVGHLQRVVRWQKSGSTLSAEVNAKGNIYLLWLESTYQQSSSMVWSPRNNYFITPTFTQKITGIRAREMHAVMSKNGQSSTVNLDDEVSYYKNENQPLYDIDTLGAQIRINLLQDKKAFVLYRQATDQIKKYDFKVVGNETIRHDKWGDLNTIKIKEVGEYSKMVLWFSPELDYQLVKAQLDAFISPMVFLTNFTEQCKI